MRIKKAISIACVGFMSYSCVAAVTTVSQTFSGTPTFNQVFTFNQFDNTDDSFISMNNITIFYSINVTHAGSLYADNESASPASGGVSFGVNGSVSSGDVVLPGPLNVSRLSSGTFNLAADEPDDGPTGDFAGPDSDFLSGPLGSDQNSGSIDLGDFGGFVGVGTFDITASVTQFDDTTSLGGAVKLVLPSSASTTVTIVYDYSAVPEPATLSFFIVGFSILGLFRRWTVKINE